MSLISRRTLIITLAGFIPVRALADPGKERVAEALIAEAVNQGRARLAPRLPVFENDATLDAIARERCADMAHGAPFDHQDERGGYPAIEKMRARVSRLGAMGENIMMDFDPAGRGYDPRNFAGQAVKSWFDSEGHRGNILSPAFTKVGTGV